MISFIVPTTDNAQLDRLRTSLNQLGQPFELIPVYNSLSFFDCWRKGVKKAKGDYLIFTHQDTEYYYLPDLDKEFTKKVGMCGVAGTKLIDRSEPWWYDKKRLHSGLLSGQIYHNAIRSKGLSTFGPYGDELKVLDGVCLVTQKDILLKVGIPDLDWCAWDYYDHVICMEYIKRGYKLKTIPIIMVHKSDGVTREREFYKAEDRFKKEYL